MSARERIRAVERGNLGDHPANADTRQVRRPVVELAGECRGVGRKITQCVRRRFGIDGARLTRIAQVTADDVTPAARSGLAERVRPREHGRAASAQNERHRHVAKCATPFASTVPIVGLIVASTASEELVVAQQTVQQAEVGRISEAQPGELAAAEPLDGVVLFGAR